MQANARASRVDAQPGLCNIIMPNLKSSKKKKPPFLLLRTPLIVDTWWFLTPRNIDTPDIVFLLLNNLCLFFFP